MKAGLKPALHCKWGLFLSLKRSDSWSYCPIAYIASLDFLYLIVNTTYPSAKITLVFITLQRQRLIGMVGFFVQVRGKIWDLRITSFDNVVFTIACMHQFVNFSISFLKKCSGSFCNKQATHTIYSFSKSTNIRKPKYYQMLFFCIRVSKYRCRMGLHVVTSTSGICKHITIFQNAQKVVTVSRRDNARRLPCLFVCQNITLV